MEQEQRQAAKRQMLEWMQTGQPWRAAAGIQVSRSTAYHWQQDKGEGRYQNREEDVGLSDHADKKPENERLIQQLAVEA